MSFKKVFGLVIKDILEFKDYILFEVLEIIVFRMGYGKNLGNKEGRMVICENDVKIWFDVLNLFFVKLQNEEYKEIIEDIDSVKLEKFEIFDDIVYLCDSGLRIF